MGRDFYGIIFRMSLTRNQIVIIGVGFVIAIVIASLFFFGGTNTAKPPAVTLTVFGTLDNKALEPVFDGYKGLRPNVKIAYARFPEATYEKDLINALAAGRGPDVFMIREGWLGKHKDKILPAPTAQVAAGTIDLFPQVVGRAFQAEGNIYALPLSIDTLVLFYNKDIFDAKGIAFPPATWAEFQKIIPVLRGVDEVGRLTRPAAAIGGSEASIENAADILNLLFLQSGVPMVSEDGVVRFGDKGIEALNFYLNFSNPESSAYAWDDKLPLALGSFADGKVAMMLGYAKDIPAIKERGPFLTMGVAPAPQIGADQSVSFPRFTGFAVGKGSVSPAWAWDFVAQVTTDATLAESVSTAIGGSPALRSLIAKQVNGAGSVFARQALTARFWSEPDHEAVRTIFSAAIRDVLSGKLTSRQAIEQAENAINGLQR